MTVELLAESRFFRRSGRSAGMSVAVYLRTRGPSASARSPVPALYFSCQVEMWMMMGEVFFWRIRTRVQECALDGAFRSRIRQVGSTLGSAVVVILTTKIRC